MKRDKTIDPMSITLSQFVRLINSTKFGTVITTEKAKRYVDLGGYNVGDGKNINLYRFAAWFFDYSHDKAIKKNKRLLNRVEDQKTLQQNLARQSRRNASDLRNIMGSDIPECSNPENVVRSKEDFQFFCEHYFPDVFFLPFNEYHKQIADSVSDIVRNGGKRGISAPRGFCKTAFIRAGMAYAFLCYPERHKYIIFLGATEDKTASTRIWLYKNFCDNPQVAADFPQVSFPWQAYNGSGRANVMNNGVPVNASWSSNLVLPTISGSPQSGLSCKFYSINTESLRGQDHIIDGIPYRPSLVFIDDPQNVKSAESETRVNNLKNIVFKEVSELAGYDRKTKQKMTMGVLVACTCVSRNDFAMQILDRKQNPDYRGIKIPRMISMPKDMRAWSQYREIRNQSLEDGKECVGETPVDATDFYKNHRDVMDEGAVTITPDEHEVGQVSGIQFAMDKWAKNSQSFFTEQQQDPESADYSGSHFVTPTLIRNKMVPGMYRLRLPENTFAMTAFIDAGRNYHCWEVTAFGRRRSFSHTVDYGIFPDQGVPLITKSTYRFGVQQVYNDADSQRSSDDPALASEKVLESLCDLMEKITDQVYYEYDGNIVDVNAPIDLRHDREGFGYQRLAMIGIDCRYEEMAVYSAIAKFTADHPEWRERIIPTYGAAAKSRLLNQYDLDWDAREWQRGRNIERYGWSNCHWIENPKDSLEKSIKTGVERSLKYDANIFKTLSSQSWLTPISLAGCHTIFDHEHPTMYANHQCNEKPISAMIGGIDYTKWKLLSGESEFLDTRTGCEALANYIGIESTL